jgi:drug/metabolite transporter (DMT)-like permease
MCRRISFFSVPPVLLAAFLAKESAALAFTPSIVRRTGGRGTPITTRKAFAPSGLSRTTLGLFNGTFSAGITPEATFFPFQDEGSLYRDEVNVEQQRQAVAVPVLEGTSAAPEQERERAIFVARMLLLGAAALYGTNFSCVKLLGNELPVGMGSTLRFGLAALATSPWLLRPHSKKEDASSTSELSAEWAATLAGLEVGAWNSVGYVAQAVGLETTLASKAAFLCSLAVVVVPLLDWITGKSLKGREMAGIVLALAGVAFLELGGVSASDLQLSSGDVASLIQPLAFGMGFWRMEKAMHKHPDQANRSTAAQLLAVFLGSALYTGWTDPASFQDFAHIHQWLTDPFILAALVWTGCITTALTVYMETVALKTLSAAETTLIFSTEPLWGSAFAAAVMGERFGPTGIAGGVLVLAGCVFSNLGMTGMQDMFQSATNQNQQDKDESQAKIAKKHLSKRQIKKV